MAAVAPPALVAGAARQALPYGLFSAVTFRSPTSDRWEAGTESETLTCEPLAGIGPWQCDIPREGTTLGIPKTIITSEGDPAAADVFTVYGTFVCSPVGWTPQRAQERSAELLMIREENRVEQAFWSGDLDNDPNLVDSGTDLTAATAVPYLTGLGMLEDHVATEYGSLGVIHMMRGAATYGLAVGALVSTGGRLTTKLGTPVVAGGGYPGTGPGALGAPAAGTAWLYITPAIFGYRTEIFTSSNRPGDLLDRSTNDLHAVSERSYLLGFDPCPVGAALVTLECPCTESAPK